MTAQRPGDASRLLTKEWVARICVLVAFLFIAAALVFQLMPKGTVQPHVPGPKPFGVVEMGCGDLDFSSYDSLIGPTYLSSATPLEVSRDEGGRFSQLTCATQTTVDEALCHNQSDEDCIDWYSLPISIVNQFWVVITSHEDSEKAVKSLETLNMSERESETWDQAFESTESLSLGEQMELRSVFRLDNLTIDQRSTIGKPLQDEAVIAEIFDLHAAMADSILFDMK